MHEIELKAHLEHPEKTEALLSRIADFSLRCVKTDRYWTLGEKNGTGTAGTDWYQGNGFGNA
ncbi:hypothetical protein [Treponema vincentii]|uniref:hypothetical protein n=1 Tax=Treponema vincentii TaxID=69710 RepID=UPI001E2AEE12|nr:hypothetical protein [Treponema vincentii]